MTSKGGDQLPKPQSGLKGSTAKLKSREKTLSTSTKGKNVRSGIKGISQQISDVEKFGGHLVHTFSLQQMKLYAIIWMDGC